MLLFIASGNLNYLFAKHKEKIYDFFNTRENSFLYWAINHDAQNTKFGIVQPANGYVCRKALACGKLPTCNKPHSLLYKVRVRNKCSK